MSLIPGYLDSLISSARHNWRLMSNEPAALGEPARLGALVKGLAIATLTFAGATLIFARSTQAQIMATQAMYFHKLL